MRAVNTIVRNGHGERIAYTWVDGHAARRDVVVIGHGLTSDRERPWSSALSAGLQAYGIASMRIAFSGNGESEGNFADSNITKEVRDLGAVLDALEGWRVGYAGHSMGGAVGVTRAASDSRICALVSLAGMVHTKEFMRRVFGHLRPGEPMLDKAHCPLSQTLVDDLDTIDTVATLGPKIDVPWLLVHGSDDELVPPSHSRDIHAGQFGEYVELPGVDHSFSDHGLAALTSVVVPWITAIFDQPT